MFRYYHNEIEYGLMVMYECLRTTSDVILATRLTGFDMEANIANSEEIHAAEATQIAQMTAWMETQASTFEKTLCGYDMMLSSSMQFHELKKIIVNDVMKCLRITNGHRCDLETVLGDNPMRQNMDQLKKLFRTHETIDEAAIDFVMDMNSHSNASKAMTAMRRGISRMQRFVPLMSKREFATALRDFTNTERGNLTGLRDVVLPDNRSMKRSLSKKQIEKARKVISKGVKLYESLFGKKTISAFLKGDEIVINGHQYDYHAKLHAINDIYGRSLNGSLSTPYILTVNRKDGTYLAKACVYFENTPVVDNLIGMTLMAADAESEVEFLKTMNLFQHSSEYKQEHGLIEIQNSKFHTVLCRGVNVTNNGHDSSSDEQNALSNEEMMFRHIHGDTPREVVDRDEEFAPVIEQMVDRILHDRLGMSRKLYEYMLEPSITMDDLLERAGGTAQITQDYQNDQNSIMNQSMREHNVVNDELITRPQAIAAMDMNSFAI